MAEGPLQYFRIESQELVAALTRGLLDLERGDSDEAIDQCFRSAHTLKGAARVVKQLRIGEIAHAIEDALAPYRESGDPLPREYVGELLRLVEAIRAELALLDPPPPSVRPSSRRSADEERFETVRVVIAEMDELLDGLGEAAVALGPLRGAMLALSEAERHATSLGGLLAQLAHVEREIAAGLGRVERELGKARARVRELRLVPASAAVGPLELAVRDAGEALGKRVVFEAQGGDIRLDGHILGVLREALLHIVRNAVDHGIEPAAERERAGKPEVGRVRLRVERRGSRVAFVCSDDGRGVDVTALRRAAVRSGLYPKERAESLSRGEAMGLMFRAGLSTRDVVTAISGRGVGLDVVRATAAKLKGQVSASSEPGQGTTVEIVVPVSLTALTALTLTCGGIEALLPIDAVRGVIRLASGDIFRGDEGSYLLFEGAPLPFAPLSLILGGDPAARAPRVAVVVAGIDGVAAIGADRLLGTGDVIVKPLPRAAGAQPLIAGAAFDEAGDPLRVLDPDGLLGAVRASRAIPVPHRAAPPRPPILVVDDSLTTRMLEQSILESEGYEVDLAASAEEGLKKAEQRRYGLFIVDVEMPGMNGFEFAERARDDAALSRVPVMMVTSFTSGDARARGARAGVRAYIVKGEFDQREFIAKVSDLLHAPAGEGG